jgi:hypothetical protein
MFFFFFFFLRYAYDEENAEQPSWLKCRFFVCFELSVLHQLMIYSVVSGLHCSSNYTERHKNRLSSFCAWYWVLSAVCSSWVCCVTVFSSFHVRKELRSQWLVTSMHTLSAHYHHAFCSVFRLQRATLAGYLSWGMTPSLSSMNSTSTYVILVGAETFSSLESVGYLGNVCVKVKSSCNIFRLKCLHINTGLCLYRIILLYYTYLLHGAESFLRS